MTTTKSKSKMDKLKLTEMEVTGVVIYSGSELTERRRDDWKESKEIVRRLYPRRRGN